MTRKTAPKAPPKGLRTPDVAKMRVKDLMPWAGNPREHDTQQLRLLKKSLDHYGLVALPIVQKGSNRILAGHGRIEALKALGHGDALIPVIVVEIGLEDAAAYTVADNRLTDLSRWNVPALREQLAELDSGAMDMEITGFDQEALDQLFDVPPPDEGDGADDAPGMPEKPKTTRGELIILGRHRILCGDGADPMQVAKLVGQDRVDAVVVELPSGVPSVRTGKAKALKREDVMSRDAYQEFVYRSIGAMVPAAKKDAAFYLWHASHLAMEVERALLDMGLMPWANLIWVKDKPTLGFSGYRDGHEPCKVAVKEDQTPLCFLPQHETGFYAMKKGGYALWNADESQSTVWRAAKDLGAHGEKPVEVHRRALMNSTRTKGLVLDSFLGVGSVLVACEELGRTCLGLELDPRKVDVAVARWETMTGRKAERRPSNG